MISTQLNQEKKKKVIKSSQITVDTLTPSIFQDCKHIDVHVILFYTINLFIDKTKKIKMHLHQQCKKMGKNKRIKKNHTHIYIKMFLLIWYAAIPKHHFTFTDLQKINETAQQPAANNCYI